MECSSATCRARNESYHVLDTGVFTDTTKGRKISPSPGVRFVCFYSPGVRIPLRIVTLRMVNLRIVNVRKVGEPAWGTTSNLRSQAGGGTCEGAVLIFPAPLLLLNHFFTIRYIAILNKIFLRFGMLCLVIFAHTSFCAGMRTPGE